MTNISGTVKAIQDIMRKDIGVDGDAQRIRQLVWLFFLKIFDDREEELELLDDDFVSPIPERFKWRNWAADKEGETGDSLLTFVNHELFPYLKEKLPTVGPAGKRGNVVRAVFEDATNLMKSGTLLRQVINKVNDIDFNNTDDRHTFGSIYEKILKDLQSAGNSGEFYTPRAVTRLIVDRLAPKLDEIVFDPACGTGGFLACTIDHKQPFLKSSADREKLAKTIRGVEKKSLPFHLCITNMILHGIDMPSGVRQDNMLTRAYRDYSEKDRVHVIATNPPFGGVEEDGIESNFPAHLRTRETADLFMALIIKLLKTNGRAGVVLPDGFLFGEGTKTTIKKELLEKCNLHTIVRLPGGVFNPYTGIKTNILFFTKATSSKDDEAEEKENQARTTQDIWFWEQPYPEGVVNYNKSKPMQFEEFKALQDWWGDEETGFKTRKPNRYAWKVSADEIEANNYNLDIKNPHVEEVKAVDPDELLEAYEKHQESVQKLRDQLKTILSEALGKKA